MRKAKQTALWNNLQFLVVLMMVIGNFIDPYVGKNSIYKSLFLFIHCVHVPLLMFAFGLFHKDAGLAETGKKIAFYMLMYVSLKAATWLTVLLTSGEATFSLFTEDGAPWIYFSLAVYECVTSCLRKVNKWILLPICIAGACLAGYNAKIGDFLILSRSIVFFPFYLMGTALPVARVEKAASIRWIKKLSRLVLMIAAVVFFISNKELYILRPLFTGRNPYGEKIVQYGYLYRMACYGLSVLLGAAFFFAVPTKKIPLVTSFGVGAASTFFWHRNILRILRYFELHKLTVEAGKGGYFVWILFAVMLTWLCASRVFSFPGNFFKTLVYQTADLHPSRVWTRFKNKSIKLFHRLKKNMFLFEELVKRDFKQKYKRTMLGMAWSVLSPLLTLLVMGLVFTHLYGRNTPHFTIYLFSGNLVMTFFKEATKGGMTSLIGNSGILTKVNVPKYMFLLSKNVSAIVNFGLSLIVYFLFCMVDGIEFGFHMLGLLYPMICLLAINVGVGLILSALFVFFRDISYLYDVFLTLLTYLSAIFYTIDRFPVNGQKLFLLNPIYCYIKYFRMVVIDKTIPPLSFHVLCAVYALIALGIGSAMYKKYNHKFLYYL